VLVRSWNVFHGNAVPPRRKAFLDRMIALATADAPDVLCLQEVPAWALTLFSFGDVAARPTLGPLPIPTGVGKALTRAHSGFLRSAFAGQGNAVQLAPHLRVLAHEVEILNPRSFRRSEASHLGLDLIGRLAWAKERRIVQVVRFADGERTFLVANLHCTSFRPDARIADAELRRAAQFAVSRAAPEDVVVLAGDFNARPATSNTLRDLTSDDWGFSPAGPGIDHVLVRGAEASPVEVWPQERRVAEGVLLSDHAPVEVEVR
jgi:endonuclease/exonuclease/phosphatase family metal-dependent hydrolase